MEYFEDYEVEPSEVDKIIDEAKNKIVKLVEENAKTELDDEFKRSEILSKRLAEKETLIVQKDFEIDTLNKKIKELTETIQKKKTEMPLTNFNIGDSVYLVETDGKKHSIQCPRCNGTGHVTFMVGDEEIEGKCPICKGHSHYDYNLSKSEVEFYQYKPSSSYEIIGIQLDLKDSKISVTYFVGSFRCPFVESEIYKSYGEAKIACEEANKKSLEKAQRELEGKETKEDRS